MQTFGVDDDDPMGDEQAVDAYEVDQQDCYVGKGKIEYGAKYGEEGRGCWNVFISYQRGPPNIRVLMGVGETSLLCPPSGSYPVGSYTNYRLVQTNRKSHI